MLECYLKSKVDIGSLLYSSHRKRFVQIFVDLYTQLFVHTRPRTATQVNKLSSYNLCKATLEIAFALRLHCVYSGPLPCKFVQRYGSLSVTIL